MNITRLIPNRISQIQTVLYSTTIAIQKQHFLQHTIRYMSTAYNIPTTTLAAQYAERGSPNDVCKLVELPLTYNDDSIVIKMNASPINPSDINMIEGSYMIKPKLPAIAGGEGVGTVVYIGKNINDKTYNIGDKVIQAQPGLGTWSQYVVRKPDELLKVPKLDSIDILQSSVISVNPCSAYRMLHDYVKLNNDDVIIQNGANSSVGLSVVQLCKIYNIKNINIVRDRDNIADLKNMLCDLGATAVYTEEELASREFKNNIKQQHNIDGNNIKLALNCVGGSSSSELSRHLSDGGVMVTYGGMSKRPVTVGTSKFIFNDITLRGFWLTRWIQQHNKQDRINMLSDIVNYIHNQKFKSLVTEVKFTQFNDALKLAQTGKKQAKVVLTFD